VLVDPSPKAQSMVPNKAGPTPCANLTCKGAQPAAGVAVAAITG